MNELTEQAIQYFVSTCYSTKGRFYHTYKHIQDMLDTFDSLFKQDPTLTSKIENYNAFRDAIIFHDIVQNTENNEQLSAKLANLILIEKYTEQEREYIKNLILATNYNKTIKLSFDMQLIRDLDLKNLANNWTDYLLNSFAIRQEYEHCTDREWKKGRSKFLTKILLMPKIFETEYFSHLENTARTNIQNELNKL